MFTRICLALLLPLTALPAHAGSGTIRETDTAIFIEYIGDPRPAPVEKPVAAAPQYMGDQKKNSGEIANSSIRNTGAPVAGQQIEAPQKTGEQNVRAAESNVRIQQTATAVTVEYKGDESVTRAESEARQQAAEQKVNEAEARRNKILENIARNKRHRAEE